MSGLAVAFPVDADTSVDVGGDLDLAEIVVRDDATGSEVVLHGTADELVVLVRRIAAGVGSIYAPKPEEVAA